MSVGAPRTRIELTPETRFARWASPAIAAMIAALSARAPLVAALGVMSPGFSMREPCEIARS